MSLTNPYNVSISALGTQFSPSPSVGLSACRSVQKVYCGKTADWIRMPFGVVNGVGREIGALDRGDDRRREWASLG